MKIANWTEVRRDYESHKPVGQLAQIHNVKAATIRERAEAENWTPNNSEAVHKERQAQKLEAKRKRAEAAGALGALAPDIRESLVQDMLKRYLQGETIFEMQSDTGATRNALYYALLGRSDDPVTRDLVTQALTARVARADKLLEDASGPYEIAKAREMAKFYRMDLERRRPALYGQQTRHEHTVAFDLGERLRRAKQRTGFELQDHTRDVIEGTVIDNETEQQE